MFKIVNSSKCLKQYLACSKGHYCFKEGRDRSDLCIIMPMGCGIWDVGAGLEAGRVAFAVVQGRDDGGLD